MKHTKGPWKLVQPLIVHSGTIFKVEANGGDESLLDMEKAIQKARGES